MENTSPSHLFKGLIYLDIINLEEKYHASDSLFYKDYFIDLSQVHFAELSAIAKLTLLIESLFKKNSSIYIALPTTKLTEKESNSTDYNSEIRDNILKGRVKVNNFLKTVGFVKVVREISEIYKQGIYFSEEYNFESDFNINAFKDAFSVIFETKSTEYYDYKFVFPLEWINVKTEIEDFSFIEERIDKILENSERGLESIDVQGIKNVIISELIKNVNEHTNSKYALFTIGLISSYSLLKENKYKKSNPIEKEYLTWLKDDDVKSQVEIYFGDTGGGILSNEFQNKYVSETKSQNKDKDAQLRWAFQKWSSLKDNEPRRGTKGLYRIQRIVNKYNGIFHITTSIQNGGYCKGGFVEEEWVSRKSKIENEGTFIQIKLCPYAEVKDFRFTLKENLNKKKWKTIQYNPKFNPAYLQQFKLDIKGNDNLLVILNVKDFEDKDAKSIIEKCLPEFSYDSHPSAVVIYLLSNLKNDTIQIITDSANEFIVKKSGNEVFQESSHRDAEDVYDPVLVIGEENQAFWYGGNQDLINLLNESYLFDTNNLKINDLETYKKLAIETRIRIRLHLENDNKLVNVDKDERLSFNFTNIDSFFENEILRNISSSKKINNIPYCSPKLEIVGNWLNIRELLKDNVYGYALTLYLKFKKSADFTPIEETSSLLNTFILIDHTQQKELAKAFASLYGINHKNIKIATEDINPNIPRRTKLFPEKSNVLILTTIISSSETVRRLVKFIKRDSAFPILILCLCNYRKYNISTLETWDDCTNIISIFQINKTEEKKQERDPNYFLKKFEQINSDLTFMNPTFTVEEKLNSTEISSVIDPELKTQIVTQKALHYNHIGIFKDRHFTFYLDKNKLLNERSSIWDNFLLSITKWKKENNITDFSIYVPKTLFPNDFQKSIFLNFLSTINKNVKIIEQETDFFNDANILFIDFGIISGKSINTVIRKCKQVQNLFICILFDQSKNNEFEFYQRIASLNNKDLIYTNPTNFKIEYLYKLPLGYFTSENCPICEHIRALDYYKISLNYMFNFSEDRQKRLKLSESEELLTTQYPYDFYYSIEHTDHELSSELIMKMFELKILLDKAELNTQWRVAAYNFIFDAYNNFDNYVGDCNSKIYALLYFLSNEVNWLQKEPLVFRDFREMIAEISYKISAFKLSDLVDKIKFSNNSMTTPLKLAVRYKYAAISVLRSTNKLLFCKSISQIIFASKGEELFSTNLLQNTFYHILSLYKNKYNKSNSYYNAISDQLSILNSTSQSFNQEQKAVLEFLEIHNNVFYLASDLKIIKSLKKFHVHFYTTNHPFPDNCMNNMNLSEFVQEGLLDISKYKQESIYYNDLLLLTDDLNENWKRVSDYIYSNIQVHTEKLSEKFKRSTFFQTLFFDDIIKNVFDGNYLLGVTDEFSNLIHEITDNPLKYLSNKEQYDSLHNKIYNNIIARNSKFSFFISQFPTDVFLISNKKFKNEFPKLKIISTVDSCEIFYPQYKLKEDLDFIINNIEKRLNNGLSVKDVLLILRMADEEINGIKYFKLEIAYDSTDQNNKPPRNGALSDIKKEVENFEGFLEYDTETDKDGFFNLKFKFIKYE
ncbi:MAG: hypothetical protein JST86_12060 [Bacteroidetes bacterium]|nr:hypothetical protein [Bacteroidota bacterium]